VPPPLLYAAVICLGVLVSVRYPVDFLPQGPARALGGLLLAAGIALGPVWGVRTLLMAGTTVRPDKPATRLVTAGPFRFSRNPLYLALTLLYAGIAAMTNSFWALLLLVPLTVFMSLFVIRREEEHLARIFGEEYRRYKARVRRWL
ncbi:MAG: isoprenylcysteine carboxylmethyltransferase family protein, partial [Methylocapsa sp.]|nr:isoprenylcysteine carboxylmethyltransferase family protein [Methylocapsa sp.]